MSAPELDALAERVILLAALRSRVMDLEKAAKAELAQALPPGASVKPLMGREPSGTVTRTVTTTTASVVDADAFAAWVERHYPQNVELKAIVRPAVVDAVLGMSRDAGVPVGPGGECGESGPAGIRVLESPGVLRAIPNKARTAELWQRIRATLPELAFTSDAMSPEVDDYDDTAET